MGRESPPPSPPSGRGTEPKATPVSKIPPRRVPRSPEGSAPSFLDLPEPDVKGTGAAEVSCDAVALAEILGCGDADPLPDPAAEEGGRLLSGVSRLIQSLEGIARERSRYLAGLAEVRVTQTAKCRALQEQSRALLLEASTWRLLDFMCDHWSPHQPVGLAGMLELPGSGTHMLVRQLVARELERPGPLQDAARVVTWLESLADDEVQLAEDKGVGISRRIHPGHGAWGATRATLQADGLVRETALRRDGLVSELDPDALGRDKGRVLHADDQEDQLQLLFATWTLLRAGRHRDAVRLLAEAGQGWRAAALSGAGAFGATPLGTPLEEMLRSVASDGEAAAEIVEELADEVEATEAGLRKRGLWRMACALAAEDALARSRSGGAGAEGTSQKADLMEAAIFGVQAGSLRHASAYAASWEDSCWALMRCALETAIDAALSEHLPVGNASPYAGLAGAGGLDAAVEESARPGGWPDDEAAAQVPRLTADADGVGRAVDMLAGATGVSDARHGAHAWQMMLMVRRRGELVAELARLCEAGALGDAPAAAGGAARGRPGWELRFAAHLGVVTYVLEASELQEAGGVASADPGRLAALEELASHRDVLIGAYVRALVEADALDLVPLYMRHYGWTLPGTSQHVSRARVKDVYDGLFELLQQQGRGTPEWARLYARGCHWVGVRWMHDSAVLRCENAAAAASEKVQDRGDALRWLSFSPDRARLLVDMPRRANALLRALSLSHEEAFLRTCEAACLGAEGDAGRAEPGVGAWVAEVVASGDPARWRELAVGAGCGEGPGEGGAPSADQAAAELAELRCWTDYLRCERRLRALEGFLSPEAARLSPRQAAEAREVLAAMLGLLLSGWDLGGGWDLPADGAECTLSLLVMPARVESHSPGEVAVCFPRDEAAELAGALGARLAREAGDGAVGVACEVADVPDVPGMALVRVDLSGTDAGRVVTLGASVAKGEVPALSQDAMVGYAREPMRVLRVDVGVGRRGDPAGAERALCREVVVPRLALHCARLRRALARVSPDSADVSDLAGVGSLGAVLGQATEGVADLGLTALLSQSEAREILELERGTALERLPALPA